MSLDKAIKYGKEHRKEYRGSKSVDKTCRNNGGCDWCESNRKKRYNAKIISSNQKIAEWEREDSVIVDDEV